MSAVEEGGVAEQTTTVGVGNKGGRDSEFVSDDFLTLVIMTGLGQLTTTCSSP